MVQADKLEFLDPLEAAVLMEELEQQDNRGLEGEWDHKGLPAVLDQLVLYCSALHSIVFDYMISATL